jgi:hypothetical protein
VKEEIEIYDSLAKYLYQKGRFFDAFLAKLRLTSRLNLFLKFTTSREIKKRQLLKIMMKL